MSIDKASPRPWGTGGEQPGQIWTEHSGLTVAIAVMATNEQESITVEEMIANAVLIVKAVNAYDALLAEVKETKELISPTDLNNPQK